MLSRISFTWIILVFTFSIGLAQLIQTNKSLSVPKTYQDSRSTANADTIIFSRTSGIYSGAFSLSLSGSEHIRYTLDASEPTESSTLYVVPIPVYKNTIIRARIIENGLMGNLQTRVYLINVSHQLPVVTLDTEDKYLWDNNIGMYTFGYGYDNSFPYFGANFWEDLEYPFHFCYFDTNGKPLWESGAGGSIFGGWSRAFDQRSFSLFARAEYGSGIFNYPFFDTRLYDRYEALILRNSGNDWDRSFLRDAVMTGLMLGTEVDIQAYQPVVTYLNGEYWGMYNMREKINEHYLASLHRVEAEEIDLIELNGIAKHGSNVDYISLRNYISSHDLSDEESYRELCSMIDETNFIQYQMANIYYDNTDWPGNNIRCWKSPGRKWRWIMFDTDFGLNLYDSNGHLHNTLEFALATNGPSWPNPPWSTLFLRKLMENAAFRRKFVNYTADAMNTIFLPAHAHAYIDATAAHIKDEIFAHRNRWGHKINWYTELQKMKNFLSVRPGIMRNFIKSHFQLPATHKLYTTISTSGSGVIKLNSLVISLSEWDGIYFEDNPVELTAVARPGYVFDRWEGDVTADYPSISINMKSSMTVRAVFKPAVTLPQSIVINEINYNSDPYHDPSDWIELHNYADMEADLSGWVLKDDNDDHMFVFPDSTIMAPYGFLVICQDEDDFSVIFPEVQTVTGEFDFGFSAEGDGVRLFNPDGIMMDQVFYESGEPWPTDANGKGSTLELLSPHLDNSLEGSWRAFPGYGTPGQVNHFLSGNGRNSSSLFLEIFPNPASNRIFIKSTQHNYGISSVRIHDQSGSLVIEEKTSALKDLIEIDISEIPKAPYFLLITTVDGRIWSKTFEKF